MNVKDDDVGLHVLRRDLHARQSNERAGELFRMAMVLRKPLNVVFERGGGKVPKLPPTSFRPATS